MSKNTTVSLTLQIKGDAAQKLKQIGDEQLRATTKVNAQWTRINGAQAKFVSVARVGTQQVQQTARASDQMLRTNRMLEGVLRQQSIQTRLMSQQLRQQQTTSQQLLVTQQRMERATRNTAQHARETSGWMSKAGAVGAGIGSGAMVVSAALQKPRDYSQQLTYITATATAGQNLTLAQRNAAKAELDRKIKNAVRAGGGTRDDAATAANVLIASGKYNLSNVDEALNSSTKTAFSAEATATDAAKMTLSMSNFGIKDIQKAQDMAVRGGQLGSFDYKDMSKWLPQQMAAASAAGYSGEQGLIELIAMNQVAKSTAGSNDEAGNNVVNFLAKLSSEDFSKAVADSVPVKKGDMTKSDGKKKPSQIFDWNGYAMQQREQGVYGAEAFVKLLDRQLADNKEYLALQAEAASAKTPESRKKILSDMSNIAMGAELGQFIGDRQALMAAMSVVYGKNDIKNIKSILPNSSGTVADLSAFVRDDESAKKIAMDQEKLFAQSGAYDAVSKSLGNAEQKISEWASGNEALAKSAYAAAIAVAALATAGVTAAVVRGGLGGGVGGAAGTLGAAARYGGQGLALAGAGAVGYGIGTVAYNGLIKDTVVDKGIGSLITNTLALFGNDTAQEALKNNKYAEEMNKQNALLEKQIQQNERIVSGLDGVKNAVSSSPGISLQAPMTLNPMREEKRNGAPPAYLLR